MIGSNKIIFILAFAIFTIISIQFLKEDTSFQVFLDKSGPYIGTSYTRELGFDGEGIKIAVIDTGVDYNHPDLFGFGADGKVIGGYDYVDNDDSPIDENGHGTEVAGIIAADGQLQGVAPKSKILAYRVSENGEAVSSELIIKAIEQAILDKADVINISLGINITNKKIDLVVNKAIEQGIVVVAAAGNNGPDLSTIGSPGINPNAITVGATYNNITASLVATLEIGEKKFQVLPMVGTSPIDSPITAEILFGQYGRDRDLADMEISDSILLVERGSDQEGEIVYFSDKESNAATHGAKAIIVYNKGPGLFLGELTHELAGPNYSPKIPALSMSGEEGLILKKMLENKTTGTIDVFYHPDFVAHFSSRGPVSPFYIKPDLVAPGAFVNTTLPDGKYNFTSGTSFAAPHVSGAAALLLQKQKDLTPADVKSLLVTSSNPISDAYGLQFPLEIAGSGRLNLTQAFDAKLIIKPTSLVFNLSPQKNTQSQILEIKSLDNNYDGIDLSFIGNDYVNLDYKQENNRLNITASISKEFLGEVQDKVFIKQNNILYNIPIISHITNVTIDVIEKNGKMDFKILAPDSWSYAKISVIDKDNSVIDTTSATPTKDATITVFSPGVYWIESKILVDGKTLDADTTVEVKEATQTKPFQLFEVLKIPDKPILIIFSIVIIIALVGLKIRK
ncbi:MAG TPA: S8 family serine peptidase [Nitrosopumilaceae archaeon]|nr:S8 family serine peptidase [Nitrosopumilaceae archaeon]